MDLRRIEASVGRKGPGLRRVVVRNRVANTRFEPEPETDVRFEGARCVSVDFSQTKFDQFYTKDSLFERCNFRGATLNGIFSGHPRTVYRECAFDGADLLGIDPGHARFEGCSFEDVHIRQWFATCAEFIDCRFSGRIETTKFFGRRPSGVCADDRATNEFRGNDFRRAELNDVGFVAGIDLDEQQLPTGEQYVLVPDFHGRIKAVWQVITEWPAEKRRPAELLLKAYSTGGMEDQKDLFARRDEASSVPRSVREAVWELLEGIDHPAR